MRKYMLVSFLVIGYLLSAAWAQVPTQQKLVLKKNTLVDISVANRNIDGVEHQYFICQLYLGDKGQGGGSAVQKANFSIEFNGVNFVAQQYDKECPAGFNATSDFGFTKIASAPSTLEYKGHSYSLSEYQTWMRLDLTQGVSNTLKSSVSLNKDCSTWVSRENNTFGILNFGLGSRFFEVLTDTYRPENPDAERIPVSWSLNPFFEEDLFDSNVMYIPDNFVFNGYRTKSKQFGMKASFQNGKWFYDGMGFRMGSRWSAFNQRVCVDPNAHTFIGLPTSEYEKVWAIIQDDTCAGKPVSDCTYSQVKIRQMTLFEVSLNSSSATLGPAAQKFDTHFSLKGTDIIKQVSRTKFLRLGFVESSKLRTVCEDDDIVIGKWFFTKAELTFWVSTKSKNDVLLSLSPIEKENTQQITEIATLTFLLISAVFAVIFGVPLAIYQCLKHRREGSETQNNTADQQDDTAQTLEEA